MKAWTSEVRFDANAALRRGSIPAAAQCQLGLHPSRLADRTAQMHSKTADREDAAPKGRAAVYSFGGMCTGMLLVFAGVFADVDRATSSLMERWGRATANPTKVACRCMQTIAHQKHLMRRYSNLPLAAVSLSKWRMQERTSGIGPTPSGMATRWSRLSLAAVVVRLSSASQRRCNKALGCAAPLNLEAAMAS